MYMNLPPQSPKTSPIKQCQTSVQFVTKTGSIVKLCQTDYSRDLDEKIHNILNQHTRHAINTPGIEKTQAIIVKDDEGNIIGAVAFRIFWGALHIKYMCVKSKYRGSGIGTKLMKEVIEYALQAGCPFIFIETLNYQAADFYKRFGFRVDFIREGFSKEVSFLYLSKQLSV